jgi:hypothetical protein
MPRISAPSAGVMVVWLTAMGKLLQSRPALREASDRSTKREPVRSLLL